MSNSFEYSCRYRDINKCIFNTLRKLVFRFYRVFVKRRTASPEILERLSFFNKAFSDISSFTIYLTSLTRTTSLFPTPDISKCILIYNTHTYVYTICNYRILHIRYIRLEISYFSIRSRQSCLAMVNEISKSKRDICIKIVYDERGNTLSSQRI